MDHYVLERCSLLDLMQHLLQKHSAASWLIVCSSKEDFEQRLIREFLTEDSETGTGLTIQRRLTLRTIAACSTIRLAFTPDLVHLRAFLSSLRLPTETPQQAASLLAILDPVAVHRPTTGYSAQGLNRTFALAIDTAYALGSQLIIHESQTTNADEEAEALDPWELDVGIVDVRTRTFGPGSRGWVGRTVKLHHIAERWLRFRQIDRSD